MIDLLYLTMVNKPKTRKQSLTVKKASLNSFCASGKTTGSKTFIVIRNQSIEPIKN